MSDRYGELVQSGLGKKLAKNLGLPTPVALERFEKGQPVLTGEVLAGFGKGGNDKIKSAIITLLSELKARVSTDNETIKNTPTFAGTFTDSEQKIPDDNSRFKVVLFDASELKNVEDLDEVYRFFSPIARKIKASGKVVIIARPECCTPSVDYAIAQRALLGFVKSLSKEVKNGVTVNLVYVKKGLESHLGHTLKFFMSPKSAYVSGQSVTLLNDTKITPTAVLDKSLVGKKILVTGASRGIGAAISDVLAREGASVICADLPSSLADLQKQAGKIGGTALPLDITDTAAAQKITDAVGVLDGIVHNAGITLDKTLAKMSEERWQAVLNVNLGAVARINEYLLTHNGLSDTARIVCVSSIAGIAGNLGQTNYAASKAGIIGLTTATAKQLVNSGRTINAVAPGFIETKMTAKIPFAIREAGRRMNSMSQGGEPVDVAETIAWLLADTGAINGQVVRVCGQSVLGA